MTHERTRRILWFVGLWFGGVVAAATVAAGLRLAMMAAGL